MKMSKIVKNINPDKAGKFIAKWIIGLLYCSVMSFIAYWLASLNAPVTTGFFVFVLLMEWWKDV